MRRFVLGLLVMVALVVAGEELIKNGNFEQQLEGWVVPSWIKNAATPELDSSDMPGAGKASLKLVGGDGKLPAMYQTLKFLPGVTKYKVSFQIKTANLNDWGYIAIYVSDDKTKKRYYSKTMGAGGAGKDSSRPWTKVEGEMDVPQEAAGNPGKLNIIFGGKTTGAVWLDDIVIESAEAAAAQKEEAAPSIDLTANILKNGNFEQQLEAWEVPSWIKNAATPEFDSADMPGPGRASLKLVGADGKLPILYQKIKFLPNVGKYYVSFQIKTQGMNDWGYVMLHIASDKTKQRYYAKTVGAGGAGKASSRPWTKIEAEMEVQPEAFGTPGKLTIQFGGKTTGTAWVDDIILVPANQTPVQPKPVDKAKAKDNGAGEEAKKKADELKQLANLVDTDIFLKKLPWIVTGWIPNAMLVGPKESDFSIVLPAGKVLALSHTHSSVNGNCSGPFRFSIWLKIPEEAKPVVKVSTKSQDANNKAGSKTFFIPATGREKDGYREYAGNLLAPEKNADLIVALLTTKPLPQDAQVAAKDACMRPGILPGTKPSLYQVCACGKEGIFLLDETPCANVLFRNPGKTPQQLKLQCTVYDYFGKKCQTFTKEYSLPPLSLTSNAVSVPNLKQAGFYAVDCDWNCGNEQGRFDFSFVRVSNPPAEADRTFGITFIGAAYPHGEAMRRLGVGTKGVLMAWRWIERADGSYNWSAIDRSVADCLANNIRIIGGFENYTGAVPDRFKPKAKPAANAKLEDVFGDDYFQAALKFEKAAVERYGKYIKEWTYGAEINLLIHNNSYEEEHYVKRIRTSAPELRKMLPGVVITGIGVSGGDGRAIPRFKVTRRLWDRLYDVLDGVSPDQYTVPNNFGPGDRFSDTESETFRDIMGEAWKIIQSRQRSSLAVGEKGFHVLYKLPMNNPHSRELANTVAREYVITKSLPITHWLYYGWRQWRDGGEYDYGMFKGPSPRHVVSAYAAIARMLCNAKFVKKADLHKNVPLYIFTRGEESIAVLWKSEQNKDISMLLDIPADARLYDVQGNPIPYGKQPLLLTRAPIYICSSAKPEQLEASLKKTKLSLPELELCAWQDRLDAVNVACLNLLNEKLHVKCTVAGKEYGLDLPASEMGTLEVPLSNKPSGRQSIEVRTPKGFVYSTEFVPEYITVPKVSSLNELKKRPALFTLNSVERHLSNVDYAANKLWTGPNDCSAVVRMGYGEKSLFLHVLVKDDIHQHDFPEPVMTWAGDCVQFAFDSRHDAAMKYIKGQRILFDDDYIFTAALVQGKTMRLLNELEPKWNAKPECVVTRDEGKKTTEYSIVLPLDAMDKLSAKSGNVFGFNLIVMDSDKPKESAKYWMQLTPGIAAGQNPSLFKAFVFE